MKNCSLPTRKESFDIIKQYNVPSHILKHNVAVAKIAVFLAERLKEKGIAVDVDLVEKASLLHDIARVCDFNRLDYGRFEQSITEENKSIWRQLRARYNGIGHEDAACDILKEKYPALALTIKKHRYAAILDPEHAPDTWEEKLLYYADMRVMHNQIVTLKVRLREAHKRNAHLRKRKAHSGINTTEVDRLIGALEQEIFNILGLDPIKLTDKFIDSYGK